MYIIHLLYPHKDIPLAEALLGGSLGMVALATGPSKPPCFRWSWWPRSSLVKFGD